MSSLKVKLAHYTWDIAYGIYSDSIITDGLKGVRVNVVKNPYKNKWFADPFILEEDENVIHFLVEEFDDSIGRGRIARLPQILHWGRLPGKLLRPVCDLSGRHWLVPLVSGCIGA